MRSSLITRAFPWARLRPTIPLVLAVAFLSASCNAPSRGRRGIRDTGASPGPPANPEDPTTSRHAAGTPGDADITDVDGVSLHPLDPPRGMLHVLFFILSDCPLANGYAPEMARFVERYAPRGVRFFGVHVDPNLTDEAARQHAKEYGLEFPILIDRHHTLVRATGATVTPEAVVVGAKGALLYRGRIDDLYSELGKKRPRVRHHDLADALDVILSGRPVLASRTRAVGCIIADVSPRSEPSP